MTPKFSVGEVVILQSQHNPEANGEYTVLSFERGIGRPSGVECYVYMLDGVLSWSKLGSWAESALRKKHQPGEHSFTDLMASLKNPVSV